MIFGQYDDYGMNSVHPLRLTCASPQKVAARKEFIEAEDAVFSSQAGGPPLIIERIVDGLLIRAGA
jgi:hypothetical protein